MTQFLNLKSQAGTSRTQAAQIGAREAQERKVRGDSTPHPRVRSAKADKRPAQLVACAATQKARGLRCGEVLSPGSTALGSPSPKDTVGWEPEEKHDWTGREAAGKARSGDTGWVKAQPQDSRAVGPRPLADSSNALLKEWGSGPD